ncbi:metallophosphoesterase [Gordonia phage Strosahl]|uniref:Metallophosphoesterase n=2 Tax=Soupsvirus strosahl TaxID=2560510 RepID=A0A1B3B193_9CAUD|nr:metallo-phosphoesterase [Gordonia phage Remus]YP_009596262.1 metallo-phosphoesterase [Gordonia phage Strosahl]AOE44671.1 metallophosphoesterase [Gordonia phage Remus]AOE44772.1 metallophosphoesterase [Gordonia phage Strosahl]
MKRIVIISDTQVPYEDRRAVKALIGFIGDYQPDEVIHIGDLVDYPQPSRWNKDTRGEFEGSIFVDSETTKQRLLGPLRDVYSGPIGIHEGNHDLRPREYLARYAPALVESKEFNFENLLDFNGFGITRLPDFNKIANGWHTTHGHLGGIRLTQRAGDTALNAAVKLNTSIIMGHTHRLGLKPQSNGFGGKITKQVWGMEVGNLMDMKLAQYLKGGTANWQQGFGLVTIDGAHVKPEIIPISNGRFSVDGRTWEV